MSRLLIVNPNTSQNVTQRLAERALALAPAAASDDPVIALTATFGAPYIVDELSVAVASHALLDAIARRDPLHAPVNAVLVGCFGDPGLLAAQQMCSVPVHGLAGAAMREAAAMGPFAIVTGGVEWPPMLKRLAFSLGLSDALIDIVAVDKNGSELAADVDAARDMLLAACRRALQHSQVRSIIIGGAALSGIASEIANEIAVPLIDSVDSGIRAAWKSASGGAVNTPAIPEWFRAS